MCRPVPIPTLDEFILLHKLAQAAASQARLVTSVSSNCCSGCKFHRQHTDIASKCLTCLVPGTANEVYAANAQKLDCKSTAIAADKSVL